jgi:hypothetical protein
MTKDAFLSHTGQAAPHPGHRSALPPHRRANDLSPGVGPRPSYAQKVIAVTLAVMGPGSRPPPNWAPLQPPRRWGGGERQIPELLADPAGKTSRGIPGSSRPRPRGGVPLPAGDRALLPAHGSAESDCEEPRMPPGEGRGKLSSARPSSASRRLCRQAPPHSRSEPPAADIRTRSPNWSRWPLCRGRRSGPLAPRLRRTQGRVPQFAIHADKSVRFDHILRTAHCGPWALISGGPGQIPALGGLARANP